MSRTLISASLGALLTATASAQITDPNTGHTYQMISVQLPWTQAVVDATNQVFNGQPGRLATINSQAELDFIIGNVPLGRVWLGGFHDVNDPNYSEPAGGWAWITGEPFTFTNWFPGEPNNTSASGGPEDYLEMFASSEWNDTEDNHLFTNQYLVEWEPTGGPIGSSYCGPANLNSSGLPAVITAFGSDVTADNNVRLDAAQMALNQFGMFVNSTTVGFVTPPGSQGNLCLSGSIGRHNMDIMKSGSSGAFSLQLDLTGVPTPLGPVAIQPGETWYWQTWFRDNNPTSTSNFTDGVGITFL
jgi:hypothetical protein